LEGITVLGINTINMALPGVTCYYLFRRSLNRERRLISLAAAFSCGFLAVFFSGILVAQSLLFTEQSFVSVAKLIVVAHMPVMIIEGIITFFCIAFLMRVKPELLGGIHGKGS